MCYIGGFGLSAGVVIDVDAEAVVKVIRTAVRSRFTPCNAEWIHESLTSSGVEKVISKSACYRHLGMTIRPVDYLIQEAATYSKQAKRVAV